MERAFSTVDDEATAKYLYLIAQEVTSEKGPICRFARGWLYQSQLTTLPFDETFFVFNFENSLAEVGGGKIHGGLNLFSQKRKEESQEVFLEKLISEFDRLLDSNSNLFAVPIPVDREIGVVGEGSIYCIQNNMIGLEAFLAETWFWSYLLIHEVDDPRELKLAVIFEMDYFGVITGESTSLQSIFSCDLQEALRRYRVLIQRFIREILRLVPFYLMTEPY